MKRRAFLALAGAAAAFPRVALAQQAAKVPRVALLWPTIPVDQMTETGDPEIGPFLKELRRLGFAEGSTISFDRYSGNSDPSSYASVANRAAAGNPALIYVDGIPMAQAAMAATKAIPIVYHATDGIIWGLVQNFEHPGGNVTGAETSTDLNGENRKRLSLLHEAVPQAKRVACLGSLAGWQGVGAAITSTASQIGLEVVPVITQTPITESTYRMTFASFVAQNIDMVQLINAPETNSFGELIGKVAAGVRMPGISLNSNFVDGGGLMSYGPNRNAIGQNAARQVADILNGAKPGDLPVIQPQIFDFVVSLKAANDLGLRLPSDIVVAATEFRQ